MWTLVKMLCTLILFVASGTKGILALVHHTDAGWLAGFIFCSTGTWLFGQSEPGLLQQIFERKPQGKTDTTEA